MNLTPETIKRLKASVWMVVGTSVVFSMIILMNNYADKPEKKKGNKQMNMEVVKQPKQKPKKKPKPKPKPKPKKAKAKSSPKPANLGSSVGGLSFGLPGFDMSAFGDMDDSLLGDTKDMVMTDDTVDVRPKPTTRIAPEYPKRAVAKGITGYVSFNLLINAEGEIEKIQILESEPAGVFDAAATDSINQWGFAPAQYKGENVKVWAKQTIRFKLGG
jgi:protein TonB